MSFLNKTDYFSFTNSNIIILSSDEGKSCSTAQARDEKGDVIDETIYGVTETPTCEYAIKGTVTLSGVSLGEIVTNVGSSYTITSISINTAAGSPPSISVSGEKVPAGSNTDCKYDVPSTSIIPCHHAQVLFGCCASDSFGTGCHLISASYTIECTLTKATKDGDILTFDVTDGKITANLTIQAVGSTAPTVTEGINWQITSPLTQSNPDSDYPTYTCALTKNLAHATSE